MARQPKHTAILSLGVMAAGFALTFPIADFVAGKLLHGGFEAGLVGGLADWFAVTALFRRPLGLPIPHTALLPRNRDKVVRSLVNVMENEFLTKDSIKSKVNGYLTPERMLGLAERHLDDGVRAAVQISDYALRQLPLERIVPVLARELRGLLGRLDTAALLRLASEATISRGLDEKALLFLLAKAEGFAASDSVRRQLGAMAAQSLANVQAKGFMGFAVGAFAGFMSEEKLGDMLQNALLSNLRSMQAYPDHPLRQLILAELRRAIEGLPANETALRELNAAKEQLPDRLNLEVHLLRWGEELRSRTLAYIEDGRFADKVVRPALASLVERYKNGPDSLVPALAWLQERIAGIVDENHSRIGQLVRENLDKLDNATLIKMIEEKVGGDLQWIRVNGAVCGFLIGLVLEGINLVS
ncbi:DUF445 domain-containing protein [Cohnella lubricantis]|uniref:DUF445 domain-containing protein n=1 Tax=Cohnella lubricantis TaxID=2163172 RepID=A0A841TC84_9BACL|nr:DUF445 domain-containing protein [Cohnella lubricantis]MBB6678622.1 DUF445 domain-containing protein [Cohnella lubricantis]MBP2119218.1 uncharacterized membrane-anchored protein YjiN (DUF445 family) [Cohnella lubricantis]